MSTCSYEAFSQFSYNHLYLHFLTELPTVVTKLKEVIGQITLQTSPTASTSATPSTSVDSASVSPQVLSDDMVSTTHASVTVHVGR